ncbi:MAG: cation diffusion facilitator family transporter [Phycisphaerae bacterium]
MSTLDPARASRLALAGMLANVVLAAVKIIAGVLGHSSALVADGIESVADIVGSVVIWGGLRVASRPRSERHPYGYGKAEALAAVVVSFMILAAAAYIAVDAVSQIRNPGPTPAGFTLAVLVVVIVVKEFLFRLVRRTADQSGSSAVRTDAWHHRVDAITSVAAFVGITLSLLGGPALRAADDWAALLAAVIIAYNGCALLIPPLRELLDAQALDVVDVVTSHASSVPGVRKVQKAYARRSGRELWIDMHIWVDGAMNVRDAHTLAHAVKDAVRARVPAVRDVLIHIEPAPAEGAASPPTAPDSEAYT